MKHYPHDLREAAAGCSTLAFGEYTSAEQESLWEILFRCIEQHVIYVSDSEGQCERKGLVTGRT